MLLHSILTESITVRFDTHVRLPIRYRHLDVDAGYRLDFIVEDAVILGRTAVEQVRPGHRAQLLPSAVALYASSTNS